MAQKPKINIRNKIGSFSFFLSIPTTFVIGFVLLISTLTLVLGYEWDKQRSLIFLSGFILSSLVTYKAKLRTFRTFIHELKHAVMVILSGNIVTDFHVERDTGHVSYKLYRNKTQFGPLIMLAPYCYPLCSLPIFITAVLLEGFYPIVLAGILGLALAFDIFTGIGEIHSHQTDIRRLRGGIFAGGSFIAGLTLMWVNFCVLWVVGGRVSFELALINFYRLGEKAYFRWLELL